MKKIFIAGVVVFVFAVAAFAAKKYTCYRYVKGHPTGTWISVMADSKQEAEAKAWKRFKKLGGRIDSCKCKYE